ncbi:hypothetical protein RSAG8_04385, partial [Rhizoctonia solani AG-8 WAC10335]
MPSWKPQNGRCPWILKPAAQSLATLLKSSKQSLKHAHNAGYTVCLQDMLQLIQSGLSTDGDGMGVAWVMDWAEGQLGLYREGREFEKVDEAIAALPRGNRPLRNVRIHVRRYALIDSWFISVEPDIHTPRKIRTTIPGKGAQRWI